MKVSKPTMSSLHVGPQITKGTLSLQEGCKFKALLRKWCWRQAHCWSRTQEKRILQMDASVQSLAPWPPCYTLWITWWRAQQVHLPDSWMTEAEEIANKLQEVIRNPERSGKGQMKPKTKSQILYQQKPATKQRMGSSGSAAAKHVWKEAQGVSKRA